MTMRILIVDDEAPVRESLASLLSTYGFETAAAASARDALAALGGEVFDCVLLDVRMPEIDGLAALRLIRETESPPPVIVITGHADVPMAVQAMKSGAHDFAEKPLRDEDLVASIEAAVAHARQAGETPLERSLAERYDSLTPREQMIAGMVVEGYSSAAIAANLGISVRTVDHHRASVLAKMQATSLPQLLRFLLAVPQLSRRNPEASR